MLQIKRASICTTFVEHFNARGKTFTSIGHSNMADVALPLDALDATDTLRFALTLGLFKLVDYPIGVTKT